MILEFKETDVKEWGKGSREVRYFSDVKKGQN